MAESWRRLALAVALNLVVGVGVAAAQTVIVKSAPPGVPVSLVFNSATVGSGTADANGELRLDVSNDPKLQKIDTDVHVFVDSCDKERRVLLLERGLQPVEPGACSRQDISGWFVFKRETSLLIDLSGAAAMVWVRQGRVPEQWLRQGEEGRPMAKEMPITPTGLVLFGGAGFFSFSNNASSQMCGDAPECSPSNFRPAFTAGINYWMGHYVAIEASYVRPSDATVTGKNHDQHTFSGFLKVHAVHVGGKAGVPIGPARVYGKVAATYQRSTFSVTDVFQDRQVTQQTGTDADDNPIYGTATLTGGTHTNAAKTDGWGWMFGGGIELWVKSHFAAYVEGGRTTLRGDPSDFSEVMLKDSAMFVFVGVRYHIGKAPQGR